MKTSRTPPFANRTKALAHLRDAREKTPNLSHRMERSERGFHVVSSEMKRRKPR